MADIKSSVLANAENRQSSRKTPIKICILEKNESDVSCLWKGCQLFSYILIVISGFGTSLAVGSTIKIFKNECPLYANLTIQSIGPNNTITIQPNNLWGDMNYCNFCQYCPVASVIFAGVWATLFMMCGRGGNSNSNLPQPWRIVPPAFLFNLVFVVLSSISVGFTFGGFSSFCSAMVNNLVHAGAKISTCDELEEYKWKDYDAQRFYDKIVVAEAGAVVLLLGWLLGFTILFIRCITHVDFLVVTKSETLRPTKHCQNTVPTTLSSTTLVSSTHEPEQQPLIAVETVEQAN